MRRLAPLALILLTTACAGRAPMQVDVQNIDDGKRIPEKYATCVPDDKTHTKPGPDVSPEVKWTPGPRGTRSYALLVHDTDVPKDFSKANKKKPLKADAPRRDAFFHWVLVNIPESVTMIGTGTEGRGPGGEGKAVGNTAYGVRGANDVSALHGAPHGGYDGPCPPWNDLRLHHYHFTLYALDIAHLDLPHGFTGAQALEAMRGHVLAQSGVTGTFSQNPKVKN